MTKDRSRFGITVAILAAASLTVMANATISPALPEIREHFADVPGIATLTGLVMTLPSLSIALAGTLAGALADRYGKRRVLLASLVLYALGGASGWWADGMTSLLAGRIVLGLGVAGVMATTMALVADHFQGPQRQRFMGWMGGAQSFGGVGFLLAGGAMAAVSWRHPFLLYLLALGVGFLAWQTLHDKAAPSGKAAAAAPTGGGVMILCTFAVLAMAAFYLMPTKLPFHLRELAIDSPVLAGTAVAASTLAGAFSALGFARLRAHFSANSLLAASFGLMALGYVCIAATQSLASVLAGGAVAGLGVGMLMPNLMGTLFSRVPEQSRGRASGMLTTAVFLGQFISPLWSGPSSGWIGLPATFGACAAVLAALAIALLAFPRILTPQTV